MLRNQNKAYEAFSNAFAIDKEAAMKATSWGLGQIMGFHYKRLGYKSVGEMVDDFKKGEYQQVVGMAKFISTDITLLKAFFLEVWF